MTKPAQHAAAGEAAPVEADTVTPCIVCGVAVALADKLARDFEINVHCNNCAVSVRLSRVICRNCAKAHVSGKCHVIEHTILCPSCATPFFTEELPQRS